MNVTLLGNHRQGNALNCMAARRKAKQGEVLS